MRPDKTNVLVSVQDWSRGQFLKVIACNVKITDDVKEEIVKFSSANNCPYIVHDIDGTSLHGPNEFIKEQNQ